MTQIQKSYIEMLDRYENARASGLRGNYFIMHILVPETGKKYSSIARDIKRGRQLRKQILNK